MENPEKFTEKVARIKAELAAAGHRVEPRQLGFAPQFNSPRAEQGILGETSEEFLGSLR